MWPSAFLLSTFLLVGQGLSFACNVLSQVRFAWNPVNTLWSMQILFWLLEMWADKFPLTKHSYSSQLSPKLLARFHTGHTNARPIHPLQLGKLVSTSSWHFSLVWRTYDLFQTQNVIKGGVELKCRWWWLYINSTFQNHTSTKNPNFKIVGIFHRI